MPKNHEPVSETPRLKKRMKASEGKNFCEICAADFSSGPNLSKHKKLIHKVIKNDDGGEIFPCPVCETLLTATSLKNHVEKSHPEAELPFKREKSRARIECAAGCGEYLKTYESYASHLLAQHDISVEVENLSFHSQTEFEAWKGRIRDAHYVKECGSYRSKNKKIEYFRCHRSYNPNITSGIRTQYKGSVKINRACPSYMRVLHTGEKVTVEYRKTHVGHSCEIGYLPLPMPQRLEISEKLAAGVSMDKILDDIRGSADTSEELERIHFVRRSDLHNISKQFGVISSTADRSVNLDNITVEDFRDQYGEVVVKTEASESEPSEVRMPGCSSDEIRSKVDRVMRIVSERTFVGDHCLIINRCLDDLIDILSIPSIESSQVPHNLTADHSVENSLDLY